MIQLTLDYPPSANRYWRNVRGRMVTSKEAQQYEADAWWLCYQAGVTEPLGGEIAITLRLYRPRKSGDLDNRIKVALDALQGRLYHNDSQIVELHAFRHDDKANPRVEIEAWQVGDA